MLPLHSYTWGDGCTATVLLQTSQLSVKRETMPPGSAEVLHLHHQAQQLFYVLNGTAVFYLDKQSHPISAGEHIHIPPGTSHRVANESELPLEFLVISQPDTADDRINQ
jgi:mannose-6-phosphate isomerase-like protein (cupin superfamily)